MGEQRSGGVKSASEAPKGHATPAQFVHSELARRYTRPEIREALDRAYNGGDPEAVAQIRAMTPAQKSYLASLPDWSNYCVAQMVDGVLGIDKPDKSVRNCASWFVRVMMTKTEGDRREKAGRVPVDATIVDAGADDE